MPTLTNAIANSRNGFSESHFGDESQRWLALFARDLTNSIGRLMLNFMYSCMPKTIEELRLALAKTCPIQSGNYGEGFACQWFKKNNWDFVNVDQARGNMHERLRALKGKRPDFIVDSKSDLHLTTVDAKFATTDNGKIFCMPDWEIEQYRMFKAFVEEEFPGTTCEVLFMVFPKEFNGKQLVWLDLSEFESCVDVTVRGHPGKQVSLEKRDELWDTNE